MTLLTIGENVADEVPVERPVALYGATDDTARGIFSAINRTIKDIVKAHNWVNLITEYTFMTVSGQTDYALPSDFKRMVHDTVWDRTNYEKTRGSLTPQEWQYYQSSIYGSSVSTWKRYRIRSISGAKYFSIEPTPSAAEQMVFEYVSTYWARSSGGTEQTGFLNDSDTTVLDEDLIELGAIWRVKKKIGLDYMDEKDEFDKELSRTAAQDVTSPRLRLSLCRRR